MCTAIRFNDDGGNFFFGRNLDWTTRYGEKVVIAPRGYEFDSAFLGRQTLNKGAIIGMAVIEENEPLYFDAANESGLAVAGLNFPGYAAFEPAPKENKLNLAAYEFPLYLLANFGSLEELRPALENMAIVARPVNEKYPVAQLHYMVADRTGSLVLEYTNRGLEIYENDIDVLTNQPGYNWHRENLRNYLNLFPNFPRLVTWGNAKMSAFGTGGLLSGLPGGYAPSDRFVRAAYFNSHYPTKKTEEENLARLFHTLAATSMLDGAGFASDGLAEITLYTAGYSSATKTYYHNTYKNPAIVATKLADYDLDAKNLIEVDHA